MRQNFVRVLGSVAIAALIAGGASACKKDEGTSDGSASKACDLKIGFFGALSGADAGLVTPMKQGADLAVEKYNAENADCKVTVQAFDSQGKADLAGGLATSAVADTKIVGMVGPAFSGESEVALPIFDTAGLSSISPSATRPSLSTKGWKVFHRGVGNDFSQGPAIASYIKNVLKSDKAFVIDDQSAYGAGLADEAKKVLGTAVIGTDKVVDNAQEFGAQISKVKTSGATVLFYAGYTEEAAPFLKQLRAAGWTGTFIGGDGINDANMLSVAGQKDVEGTIATCPCGPATAAKGTFVTDFKAKYSVDPGVYADVSFDLANIYLEAIKAGKTTRADIQAFLSTYNKAGSASGVTYKWEPNGELDPAQVKVWAFKATAGAWAPDVEIPKA
ncbi:branched-chain amino acid ABC transporter substrate-binding protein [Micromonospora sp. ALFpr18c]|uniref:branched-chain amino acid ABC transporter substrate-binding protein n=1 Tax=unclassified Micromonospora TaxID=2617518 RepID=UPI00124AF6F0|nr:MULTISPECIES: branched-chain amino acid ABC transporter substrate-binding protein [unclassified Micromonospora]KAB1932289.1 branched-chain amino acid ABC transporter substrate-binding protein [Micromonospora sp. ALFpr18c]MDG4757008.1 branched-chain amino acid ABC transporter substrate-binding protein [Micromonospora sp. WMMD710]